MKVDLTREEMEIIRERVVRKALMLEEAGLTDSFCYPRLMAISHKLRKALKENEDR